MRGWKTWAAAVTSILWGIGGYLGDLHSVDVAMGFVTGGFGMIGLGHKLDKAA